MYETNKRKRLRGRCAINLLTERAKAEDAGGRFAMRVIWFTLAIACAVLGSVLFMILLR